MLTHFTQSIHLGTCLNQNPAYGFVAILSSVMERGALDLRGGGVSISRVENCDTGGTSEIDKANDRGNHGLGMHDLSVLLNR